VKALTGAIRGGRGGRGCNANSGSSFQKPAAYGQRPWSMYQKSLQLRFEIFHPLRAGPSACEKRLTSSRAIVTLRTGAWR